MTTLVPVEAQSLQQWLSRQPRTVVEALDRARRLAEFNQALHAWCDEPWVRQIRLANIRGDTLIFYCSSAAVLVPLRFRSQSLLAWINQRFTLNCCQVEAKIAPVNP